MSETGAEEGFPELGIAASNETVPRELWPLDFTTPELADLVEVEEAYEELEDTWNVMIGDVLYYAKDPDTETSNALAVNLTAIEERTRTAIYVLHARLGDGPDFAAAVQGLVLRHDEQWVRTCNEAVATDNPPQLKPQFVSDVIEASMAATASSEEIAEEIALECRQAADATLTEFFSSVHSRESWTASNVLRIVVGNTAVTALFDLTDGSHKSYTGYSFRLHGDIDIIDPSFMGDDVVFGYRDQESINGTYWIESSTVKAMKRKHRKEKVREVIHRAFSKALNAFGDKQLSVLYQDEDEPLPEAKHE